MSTFLDTLIPNEVKLTPIWQNLHFYQVQDLDWLSVEDLMSLGNTPYEKLEMKRYYYRYLLPAYKDSFISRSINP